jgi:hypothetical protein
VRRVCSRLGIMSASSDSRGCAATRLRLVDPSLGRWLRPGSAGYRGRPGRGFTAWAAGSRLLLVPDGKQEPALRAGGIVSSYAEEVEMFAEEVEMFAEALLKGPPHRAAIATTLVKDKIEQLGR